MAVQMPWSAVRSLGSAEPFRAHTAFTTHDAGQANGYEERGERIDRHRLWKSIMSTSVFGMTADVPGMYRLALSDSDKQVREWFRRESEKIGCRVKVDAAGNQFAILPGINNQIAPIGIGSHLDTQPAGGRFDGILGVIGALEILKTIKANGISHYAPIAAINWTNEEGAAFESGCTGSAVWSHHTSLSDAYQLPSLQGDTTFGQELRRIGHAGPATASYRDNPLSAHFELHIEQGARLERSGSKIGVVTGIQGQRRYQVTVRGEKRHAGSTPMDQRTDALTAAAKAVLAVEKCARDTEGFGTVGTIQCPDGSPNCVPGLVHFAVDLRHQSPKTLDMNEEYSRSELQRLTAENSKLEIDCHRTWELPPADFTHEQPYRCVASAARTRFGANAVEELTSFAGHDSAMIAQKVPTAMIFVPSKDGISHSPEEYTSPQQCADGVQVLLDSVLAYDRWLRVRLA